MIVCSAISSLAKPINEAISDGVKNPCNAINCHDVGLVSYTLLPWPTVPPWCRVDSWRDSCVVVSIFQLYNNRDIKPHSYISIVSFLFLNHARFLLLSSRWIFIRFCCFFNFAHFARPWFEKNCFVYSPFWHEREIFKFNTAIRSQSSFYQIN